MYVGIVTLYVNDQDRAKRFYTEKLGWEVRDDAPMGESRWLSVAPKGAQTAVVLCCNFADWSEDKVGGMQGIAIEVDDVFAACEQFKKNGVEIHTEPEMQYFGGWAVIKDSEGNEIGIHSPAREMDSQDVADAATTASTTAATY